MQIKYTIRLIHMPMLKFIAFSPLSPADQERELRKEEHDEQLEECFSLYEAFEMVRQENLTKPSRILAGPLLLSVCNLALRVADAAPAECLEEGIAKLEPAIALLEDPRLNARLERVTGDLKHLSALDATNASTSKEISRRAWRSLKDLRWSIERLRRTKLRTPMDLYLKKRRMLALCAALLLLAGLWIGYRAYKSYSMRSFLATSNGQRVKDLQTIKAALNRYYADHRSYVPTNGRWDGLYSAFGQSKADWIPGLVPGYLDRLPRDPRNHMLGDQQYIYWSDGRDYKVIAHNPPDCCQPVLDHFPGMRDPIRPTWAIGVWSPGAASR